jgi:methylmalonyl-CoA mutase cobalamin-binding subunit
MDTFTTAFTFAQQDGTLLDKLLGLRELSWSDPSAGLGFEYVLPAWLWLLIGFAALLFAGWSYRRLLGSRSWRVVLALVRTAALIAIAILLAGPTLVLPQETIERDWLMVLVDRSASMGVQDVTDTDTGEPISRDQSVRDALREQAAVFSQDGLGKARRVVWLGFGASAYTIGSPLVDPGLSTPDAHVTSIRTAIEQALRLPSGKPVSGIVLITDGRTPQDTGPQLVQRLQQQGVAMFTVPVGAARPPLDLTIGQADGPQRTFLNDTAPVAVTIDQLGGDPIEPGQISVALIDQADGTILDEQTLDQAQPGQPLRLSGKSSTVGLVRWLVRVTHKPPAGQPPIRELVTENNTRIIEMEVIDRPIRVLYIEGYPRWEFRYLKNLLIREKSISASTYLLSADRSFAQEGDVPITRPPVDAQEMNAYDVVILGDVSAEFFNTGQLTVLRDHVSAGGSGLIWIGGELHTPRSYAGTPLADLLPMHRPTDVSRAGTATSLFKLEPTLLARSLNVMRLRGVDQSSVTQAGWPDDLPPLRWMQNLGELKPTAEVIAEASKVGVTDELFPAIVRLRYGAGQSLYIGTDEAWRWRYGRGEWYFEQHWVQMIRMLGRARIQSDTDRARFTVSNKSVSVQQPIVVELDMSDPLLINRGLSRVDVSVRRASDPTGPVVDSLELMPVAETDVISPGGVRRAAYRSLWRPTVAGTMVLTVTDPALAELGLVQTVHVTAPDDEMLNPRSDHERLAVLAEQTGGAVAPLNELDRLVNLVPNRARITPTDIREPLWDSALSLIVLIVLFSFEWVVRRAIRLA